MNSILIMIGSFLLGVVKVIAVILAPFVFMCVVYLLYYFARGHRFKKGSYRHVKYGSILKRIFIDFPRQFIFDRYNADPDFFRDSGVHIIEGEQGSGKTVALVYMLLRYQKMYPRLKVRTNMDYTKQDGDISHWHDIINNQNGIYGQIDVLDEIQNWFSSLQSKDFPPEMLTEITQQRKQRKIIFGTTQVFTRMSKPLREQTTMLYRPLTLFGCLTVVRMYKPRLDADGQAEKVKLRKMFFFVHNEEIRNSFDTYKKIEKMKKSGFKSDLERKGLTCQ